MKIGMLVGNMAVSGGYQKLVIRLGQQLEMMGHKVTIYCPLVDKTKCYPKDIKSLNIVSIPKDQANGSPVAVYQKLVPKISDNLDATIIHDELSLLGVALMSSRPKKIIWMLNNQLPENLRSFRTEMRSVYSQTVGPLKTKASETKKAYNRVKLMRQGLRAVTDFVTYDEFNKSLVRRVLKRPAVVVSAGADLNSFKKYAKERTFKVKSRYTLLSVGVLFPHRRYEDLIGAVSILKKRGILVKAIIVGRQDLQPDYYQKLVKLVSEKDIKKEVTFKNYVTDDEMVQLYKKSDAFIFINDGFTWGISVFEAVAAKLPVIITNNIGAADLVKNNKSGWVVDPRSSSQVAKAVEDITKNRDKTHRIAEQASQELTEFVSWEAYTKRMIKIINS